MPAFKYFNNLTQAQEWASNDPHGWGKMFILQNRSAVEAANGVLVIPSNKLRSASILWDVTIIFEVD